MNKEKRVLQKEGVTYYSWYLLNPTRKDGVHLHGCVYDKLDTLPKGGEYNFIPWGIEAHRITPMYENHEPLKDCHVTGGDCYHDGSGTAALQFADINPKCETDDEHIFSNLTRYYKMWVSDE